MNKEYLRSVRTVVTQLLELIYSFDNDKISEMEFYRQWTLVGNVIIETRENWVERINED